MKEILGNINYLALFAAGIAYWLVGMIWFSLLVGKSWSIEIQKHGITIKKPTSKDMALKSIFTFLLNLLVSFGIAIIVYALGVNTLGYAIGFGCIIGVCFAAASMGISYIWESRSLKLSLIDVGYPILGIIVSTLIIAFWR